MGNFISSDSCKSPFYELKDYGGMFGVNVEAAGCSWPIKVFFRHAYWTIWFVGKKMHGLNTLVSKSREEDSSSG